MTIRDDGYFPNCEDGDLEYLPDRPDNDLVIRGFCRGVEWHERDNTIYVDALVLCSGCVPACLSVYSRLSVVAYAVSRTCEMLDLPRPTVTITGLED